MSLSRHLSAATLFTVAFMALFALERGLADTPPSPAGRIPAASLTPERARAVAARAVARLAREHGATRASVVILEPATGRLLAAAGAGPDGDAQAFRPVPTGSTMKALTVSAALESGLDPDRRFPGEGGTWKVDGVTIHDVQASDWLDARRTLVRSSNVGAAHIAALGTEPLLSLIERLGWRGSLAPGLAPAPLPPAGGWAGGRGLVLATGNGTRAAPLQLASAYGAIAAGGLLASPTQDGTAPVRRVLSAGTATQVTAMLEAAVIEGTGRGAQVQGLRVAGKTGTAASDTSGRTWGHFVGFVPAEAPRWVVAVSAEVAEGGYPGGSVAAPEFARVVKELVEPGER